MRYELTNYEWAAVRPFLPNKPGGVPRVNDWRVLNGIFWDPRSGAPWRDLPETFGPYESAPWMRSYRCSNLSSASIKMSSGQWAGTSVKCQ